MTAATLHSGGGQMGGVTHAKLRNVRTGAIREWRFRPEEVVQDVPMERQTLQLLYGDDEFCHFMNTETFDQVAVERARSWRLHSALPKLVRRNRRDGLHGRAGGTGAGGAPGAGDGSGTVRKSAHSVRS